MVPGGRLATGQGAREPVVSASPACAAAGQRGSSWTTKAGDDHRWQNSEQAGYDAKITTGFRLRTPQGMFSQTRV